MAKSPPKTDAELTEEASRQAEAALTQLGEPAQTYLSGGLEEEEQVAAQAAAAQAQAADQQSDASEHARLARLEQLVDTLLAGFQHGSSAPLVLPATAADLPRKKKHWTPEELVELITITIFQESDPNLNRPVDVSPNGIRFTIPRGVPTRVPRYVALVLEDACIESWEHPIENGNYVAQKTDLSEFTTTPPVRRRTPRFNFSYS